MRMRKQYGQSREDNCHFCEKRATLVNKQGVSVCPAHVNSMVDDKKCVCGEWMSVKKGKFGAFYLCPGCGPKSFSKADEMEQGGFKLNKKFRNPAPSKKKDSFDSNKIYSLDDLEDIL